MDLCGETALRAAVFGHSDKAKQSKNLSGKRKQSGHGIHRDAFNHVWLKSFISNFNSFMLIEKRNHGIEIRNAQIIPTFFLSEYLNISRCNLNWYISPPQSKPWLRLKAGFSLKCNSSTKFRLVTNWRKSLNPLTPYMPSGGNFAGMVDGSGLFQNDNALPPPWKETGRVLRNGFMRMTSLRIKCYSLRRVRWHHRVLEARHWDAFNLLL